MADESSYDAIVIGAGLGGLSAGLALARAGRSVLLLERQDGPGGNAHAFQRGPYTFDPAIHVTAHGFNIEFLNVYLEALGIADRVDLTIFETLYDVDIEGSRFTLPTGFEALAQYLAEQFPADADGIRKYLETTAEVTRESQAPPPRVALKDLDALVEALPMLFKYRMSTLGSVIDEFVTDPKAKAVLGAQWPYMGLPPSALSFLTGTGFWMAFLEPGPVYVTGSFQKLADALADGIRQHGGQIAYETRVTDILVEGDRAAGVRTEEGRELRAPVVVSNADARLTFEELLGEEHLAERFLKRVRRMKPSVSAFMVYSACTLPLHEMGLSGEVFVYDHWDHDETWADVEAGRIGGMWLSLPTLHDRSLAPEGEHLVIFTSLMRYDIGEPWEQAKERYTEQMLARAEQALPGYRDSITFLDSATPETFEHFTLAHEGAIYGWANTPNQSQPKRLPFETPIGGLYLAGHWTDPGTGSIRCLLSGLRTAAAVKGYRDPMEFLGTLG